jgi:hypothetical protein
VSAEAAVLAGRQSVERLMIDRCIIRRFAAGDRVWNEDTLQYDLGAGEIVYTGRCRVQVRADINSNAVEAVIADHEWTYRTATVQLPIEGTEGVVSDCVLELTESPLDPARVGLVLNLQADSKSKTHATHRRFRAREVLS